MKLWRRNKRVEELPSFLRAGLIKFNQRLHSIANFLQQKTNDYSQRKKKVLLALLTCVFISESMMIIVQSFTRKSETAISITRIKTIPLQKGQTQNLFITEKEFLRIQSFKNTIDSLNATPARRKLRDSLLHNRPHLMDSVNFLINLYLEQSKTK